MDSWGTYPLSIIQLPESIKKMEEKQIIDNNVSADCSDLTAVNCLTHFSIPDPDSSLE